MKLKLCYIFAFLMLLSRPFLYSQKEINNFTFDTEKGLNFSATAPNMVHSAAKINLREDYFVSSTISDSQGNLLFYTNNTTVWNKNHQIMENGSDIFGYNSSLQGDRQFHGADCIIVPKPQSPGKYLVISVGNYLEQFKLYYSEVDMNLNGGLGKVVSKNVGFYSGTKTNGIAAVRQKNSENVWVVNKINMNEYASFLITPTGIMPPLISHLDDSNVGGVFASNIVFSPNGKKFATQHHIGGHGQDVFAMVDFDPLTGMMDNFTTIDLSCVLAYEFSPSGKYFYKFEKPLSNGLPKTRMYQFDVNNSVYTPVYNELLDYIVGTCFLGPDGKIYMLVSIEGTTQQKLMVMNNPEELGVACNITEFDGGGQMVASIYNKYMKSFALNPSKKTACVNLTTTFYANSENSILSVDWDFGDGNTGSGIQTQHLFTNPGTYHATAFVHTSNGIEYIEKEVNVYTAPTAPALLEDKICIDTQGSLYNLQNFEPQILGTQLPQDVSIKYYTSLQDIQNDALAITPSVLITQNRVFYAKVINKNSGSEGCFAVTQINIQVYQKPIIPLQDKYFLCENENVVLTVTAGFDQYLWSTGSTTSAISISNPGNYWVKVVKNHGNILCEETKNFEVVLSNKATIVSFNITDFSESNNNSFTVLVNGLGNYNYSIDGIHYQESNYFEGLSAGTYPVYVKDLNGCGIVQGDVLLLSYPKFFTPNGDGFNDVWKISTSDLEPNTIIRIVDRYGKLIKTLKDHDFSWDGTLNGENLPSTDYWFVLTKSDGKEFREHFSLKR